ncbi:hypothetical protein EYF80_039943 [Liparis tanakae]|uniref:Uncharacterized protein n=1 Tax=Liparis tanakae TaxID=230148 RepID=A0A4Z2G9G8_9TELE|nr:hypothetical protein EYF80_039943 [Liparis tanakae]
MNRQRREGQLIKGCLQVAQAGFYRSERRRRRRGPTENLDTPSGEERGRLPRVTRRQAFTDAAPLDGEEKKKHGPIVQDKIRVDGGMVGEGGKREERTKYSASRNLSALWRKSLGPVPRTGERDMKRSAARYSRGTERRMKNEEAKRPDMAVRTAEETLDVQGQQSPT